MFPLCKQYATFLSVIIARDKHTFQIQGEIWSMHAVLRSAARIGDFREVLLPSLYPNPAVAPAEAIQDDVAFDTSTVDRALRLSCWINTQEIKRFSAPYEEKDSDAKFLFFLDSLGAALVNGPPELEYVQEYTQVCLTCSGRPTPSTDNTADHSWLQHTGEAAPCCQAQRAALPEPCCILS